MDENNIYLKIEINYEGKTYKFETEEEINYDKLVEKVLEEFEINENKKDFFI